MPRLLRDKPNVGAHIYGLYLEGATWHSKRATLVEPLPKQLFSEMNVLWLIPTAEPLTPASSEGAYDCPLYQTTSRGGSGAAVGGGAAGKNFVCFVRLPSEEPEAHWIKRSTALVCNLDD